MAQAFDLACVTKTVGALSFAYFAKGGIGNAGASFLVDTATHKPIRARGIAAHPCKRRKDGAPPLEMVHTEILRVGHPPILAVLTNKLTTLKDSFGSTLG